jgi:hypothetical protein
MIHIGDANASNIKSVWVRHNQSFDKNKGICPDYIVEHPDELPALIAQILKSF